jgi:hypothetical protein
MRFRRVVFTVPIVAFQAALGWLACNNSNPGAPGGGSDGGFTEGGEGDAGADVLVVGADVGSPTCVADGGFTQPSAVPAFGSFSGPELSGAICSGGAFAFLEHTSGSLSTPSQLILIIDPALSGNPADFIHFATPVDATGGELTILAGVSAATPGTYPSSGACGGVALCVYLPVPTSVDCGDAGAPTSCPEGCSLQGPGTGPTCMPDTPENCYSAQGSSDCVYGTQTPNGSWTLTLTSVVPYGGGDGGPGDYFVVHGTLTSIMVGDDASLGSANLSVGF